MCCDTADARLPTEPNRVPTEPNRVRMALEHDAGRHLIAATVATAGAAWEAAWEAETAGAVAVAPASAAASAQGRTAGLVISDLDRLPETDAVARTLASWHATAFGGRTAEERVRAYLRGEGGVQPLETSPLLPLTLVAQVGGEGGDGDGKQELAGSVALVRDDLPDGGGCEAAAGLTPWLATLYVHPVYRGRGVGAALVQEAMYRAAVMGHDRLYLWTPQRRLADTWYADMGWVVHAVVDGGFRQHTHPVFVMVVDLRPPPFAIPEQQRLPWELGSCEKR